MSIAWGLVTFCSPRRGTRLGLDGTATSRRGIRPARDAARPASGPGAAQGESCGKFAIAGLDVYFLQILATAARLVPASDAIIGSEVSVALYLLPAMFGGIGVNMISHILVIHLVDAERRFIEQHPDAR